MATWRRENQDVDLRGLVYHSDRGVQYRAIRYSQRLAEAGAVASVGSKGDSFDNAMAEAFNSLVQGRTRPQQGSVAWARRPGDRHRRVHRLVQQPAPARRARARPTRRTRGTTRDDPNGHRTPDNQLTNSLPNPGLATVRAGEVLEHVVAQVVTHRVDVPVRPPQQPLHSVGRHITGLLGEGPAVRPVQARDQPGQYCRARRRGSQRVNRPPIRTCNRSSSANVVTTDMGRYVSMS